MVSMMPFDASNTPCMIILSEWSEQDSEKLASLTSSARLSGVVAAKDPMVANFFRKAQQGKVEKCEPYLN